MITLVVSLSMSRLGEGKKTVDIFVKNLWILNREM